MPPVASSETEIVRRLVAARRGGAKLAPAEVGGFLHDPAQCYAIQQAVTDSFGPAGAFKVACRPGQPVIMAPILAAGVRASPARFAADELDRIGIELEVGFLLRKSLPAPDDAEFEERARDCVAAVPVLEIVDTRLTEIEAAPPLLRLADNQLNGGLVVGEPLDGWRHLNLATVKARLVLGGVTVLDGAAEVPGGDAFDNFCVLARMVGSHCGGLVPGQVVITGSLNGMPFVDRGTSVQGFIEGLGEVTAEFPV